MSKTNIVARIIQKSDRPVQITREGSAIGSAEWIDPELNILGLEEMVTTSAILPQCVSAYKNNICGYGIGIKYKDGVEENEATIAEWNRLEDIINLLTIEEDTKELFEKVIEAREKYGIAYVEVIRNFNGEVVQLEFITDTSSIQQTIPLEPYIEFNHNYKDMVVTRMRKFRKYKQEINGKTVYFKEFRDPRTMDMRTGKYDENVEMPYQANEILAFKLGTKPYGEPRWQGPILTVEGARLAEGLNNNYFHNGRHVPMAIIVRGGSLTKDSFSKIQKYMEDIEGANGQHKFLLLEVEGKDTAFEEKMPEVELKDMANILQKDELFQDYIDNCRRKVQSSFNLPDLYVGYTTDFNRATAQMAFEVTEKQVFQPARKSLAWIINNVLLNEYAFKYVEVEFLAPVITNPDDLYKIYTVANNAGGLTPNAARQLIGNAIGETLEDYDGQWGDIPLAVQQMNRSDGQQLATQVQEQIQKAMKNGESDEVIGVMSEVKNLLLKMREQ